MTPKKTLYVCLARIYKTCNRCRCHTNEIEDDGHGRGVCTKCHAELQMKKDMRVMSKNNPICAECGKAKPRFKFSEYWLEKWDSLRTDKMVFGKRLIYQPKILCQSCELKKRQQLTAKLAESELREKSIKWWKRGTKLTEKQLSEELIETKTTEMKVRNLWQSPQT